MGQEHCKMQEDIYKDVKADESIKEVPKEVIWKEDIQIWHTGPKDWGCQRCYEAKQRKWKQTLV
eukprot:10121202-Ditylum_brightwellii.AAC.1